eukprot:NODE_2448_length_2210_cov_8.337014.p1 GENE.NODE_2448_length_2210_cov_8.337014~~NODE_2448_length_2210_cov_8.337014.p1  ORF type:complete len:611 (+),score=165.38 NODE_2448_length_2210_cov_8.337014:169-2001(+)
MGNANATTRSAMLRLGAVPVGFDAADVDAAISTDIVGNIGTTYAAGGTGPTSEEVWKELLQNMGGSGFDTSDGGGGGSGTGVSVNEKEKEALGDNPWSVFIKNVKHTHRHVESDSDAEEAVVPERPHDGATGVVGGDSGAGFGCGSSVSTMTGGCGVACFDDIMHSEQAAGAMSPPPRMLFPAPVGGSAASCGSAVSLGSSSNGGSPAVDCSICARIGERAVPRGSEVGSDVNRRDRAGSSGCDTPCSSAETWQRAAWGVGTILEVFCMASGRWNTAVVTGVEVGREGEVLTAQYYPESGAPQQKSLYRADWHLAPLGTHNGEEPPPGFTPQPSQTRPGQTVYLDHMTSTRYATVELAWQLHFQRKEADLPLIYQMPFSGSPSRRRATPPRNRAAWESMMRVPASPSPSSMSARVCSMEMEGYATPPRAQSCGAATSSPVVAAIDVGGGGGGGDCTASSPGGCTASSPSVDWTSWDTDIFSRVPLAQFEELQRLLGSPACSDAASARVSGGSASSGGGDEGIGVSAADGSASRSSGSGGNGVSAVPADYMNLNALARRTSEEVMQPCLPTRSAMFDSAHLPMSPLDADEDGSGSGGGVSACSADLATPRW